MAKFWRSGMIDKKVVKEREQKEYINKLHRTIIELSRKPPEPEPNYAIVHTSDNRSFKREIPREKPLTPTQSAKKWGEGVRALFTGEYDEVRRGDETILEFNKHMYEEPGEPIGKKMMDSYSYWIRKNAEKRCKADIEFGRKIEALENESNTRTLRQEE